MSRYDIPEHARESLMNYFNNCWEPGSFITSVLCNDLFGAATRADHINRPELANIVVWVMNNAPYGSYGSHEAVQDWLNRGPYQQRYEKQRLVDILSTDNESC